MVGLKSVPAADRPFVPLVFYSFRIMVYLWGLMLFMMLAGVFLYFRKQLFQNKWYLWASILCSPIGFISIITGWFTAEFGRQPWVVYNALRTAAAASPSLQIYNVIISLALIIVVYGIIFGYFYFHYFFKSDTTQK